MLLFRLNRPVVAKGISMIVYSKTCLTETLGTYFCVRYRQVFDLWAV
jgi:hypothetical protein